MANAQTVTYQTLLRELQTLQKQLVPDKRVAILDIVLKDTLQPVVVVAGQTDLPGAKAQIVRLLTDYRVAFVDSVKLLPDASLGNKTWALVTLSVANLRAQPDHASELVSQALMGTPLKVLDVFENWYRVQTPDGYIGWMDANALQRMAPNELELWKRSDRYLYINLSGNAYNAPRRKGEVLSDLGLGDLFEVEAKTRRFLKVKFPDGRTGFVPRRQCMSFAAWSNAVPTAPSVISVAKQMMGFPYLWGGTSGKAVDCSGFVKLAYFSQGVILARDASQQARYGQPVDIANVNNLQAGDLLFFGRSAQRITHVGLYLEGGNFIHSSGRVHISSIVPTDPKYVATRHLVAACRVLNSLDTQGIVSVKFHPWYTVQP